jgi:hypothetical protein
MYAKKAKLKNPRPSAIGRSLLNIDIKNPFE